MTNFRAIPLALAISVAGTLMACNTAPSMTMPMAKPGMAGMQGMGGMSADMSAHHAMMEKRMAMMQTMMKMMMDCMAVAPAR